MTKPSPVMAALAEMQGSGPGPAGSVGVSEASGVQPAQGGAHQPSEELLASWRKSLEQSLLTGFPFPMDQQRPTVASPLSTRSVTPPNARSTPLDQTRSKT